MVHMESIIWTVKQNDTPLESWKKGDLPSILAINKYNTYATKDNASAWITLISVLYNIVVIL